VRSLLLCHALVSCVDQQPWVPETIETFRVERKDIPLYQPPGLDLLFVVDVSPAMRPHAEQLANNWLNYINVLDTIVGGRPSLHLAVTTSDPDDDGGFHDPTGLDDFLIDESRGDRPRLVNYAGSLGAAFTAAATLTEGSTSSQPLAMARRALLQHPDFLRERAELLIVVITAQDDGSLQSVEELASFFKSAKEPGKFGIGTVEDPVSPRLRAFRDRFPGRNTSTTIHQEDLSGALQLLGSLRVTIGDPCFETVVHEERCVAWLGFEDRADWVLPRCQDNLGVCFGIGVSAENCLGGSHQYAMNRGMTDANRFTIECEVE
jgi:hypothetical protein